MKCRHCAAELERVCLDLGSAPPSNAYLSEAALRAPEAWVPLRLLVCERCWLVQTEDHTGREDLFSADYAYFSSFSSSWLAHAEAYVRAMRERFGLTRSSLVCVVAANDGYLLRFVRDAGIPCYGVEPTASTARVARGLGLEIVERFFGVALGQELADDVDMLYCHSAAYAPAAEAGLHPRDPRLAIAWPLPIAALSPRDDAHAFVGADFDGVAA